MPSETREPRWLTPDEIIWVNKEEVAKTGEPFRLADQGLLESAVGRPRNLWWLGDEEDVLRLAVTLLYGVVKNHAFGHGNKRTATAAALLFLDANGYEWTLPDNGELANWVNALVVDELTQDGLADLMRPHVKEQ